MESAERLCGIEPFYVMELLARAKELEAAGRDIIHMEVGEPDFPTPEPVRRAGAQAILDGRMFYTNALGLPELRQAISDFYRDRYGVVVPASRVVVTAGASGALVLALACLANPASEWLLPDPGYPCNRHFVKSFDAVPIGMHVGPDTGFQPTVDDLARHWSDRTAGVMVASPANPTGTMLSDVEIRSIAEFTRNRGLHLIVDEIYHGLTYDGDAPTALAAGDDIFVVNSFSKYFQMTGWRLGWLVVPDRFVRDIEKLAQNLFIAASTAAQHAALAAFKPETIVVLEERRAEMKRRRDFLVPALESVGLKIPVRPSGAFYIYADCSGLTDDSDCFCRKLLEEVGVAVTPGKDFGVNQPQRYIRLAYANQVSRLSEAVDRIREFVARHGA